MSNEGHMLRQAAALAERRRRQIKAIEAFSRTSKGRFDDIHLYEALVQVVVQELHWDSAAVCLFEEMLVPATFHMTQRQLRMLQAEAMSLPGMLKPYIYHEVFSTEGRDDASSLALRSLFHTDELAGAPIVIEGKVVGFLLACGHTARGKKRGHEDVIFLKTLAALTAQTIENYREFSKVKK